MNFSQSVELVKSVKLCGQRRLRAFCLGECRDLEINFTVVVGGVESREKHLSLLKQYEREARKKGRPAVVSDIISLINDCSQ